MGKSRSQCATKTKEDVVAKVEEGATVPAVDRRSCDNHPEVAGGAEAREAARPRPPRPKASPPTGNGAPLARLGSWASDHRPSGQLGGHSAQGTTGVHVSVWGELAALETA